MVHLLLAEAALVGSVGLPSGVAPPAQVRVEVAGQEAREVTVAPGKKARVLVPAASLVTVTCHAPAFLGGAKTVLVEAGEVALVCGLWPEAWVAGALGWAGPPGEAKAMS
ncbi:MAG: hypothetical protein N2447_09745 [Thermoanaerobaculum sp.]|nr:hypothetical protein [Thermoanaerobaculum sp.]